MEPRSHMTIAALRKRLEREAAERNIDCVFKERASGGVSRITATRRFPSHSRYIRFTDVSAPSAAWTFEILGGQFESTRPQDNFDGRGGGDTEYAVHAFRIWTLDEGKWSALVPFEDDRDRSRGSRDP